MEVTDTTEELTEAEKLLAAYQAKKAAGEDYVTCPRCDGEGTETAVPIDMAEQWRAERYAVEYPCPLCNKPSMITIDIDEAIEWLEEKVEAGEDL